MRSNVIVAAVVIVLASTSAFAQSPVKGGSLEVNGNTAFAFSRQSMSPEGESGSVNNDISTLGVGLTYYVTPMLGIGAAGSYQKMSFGVAGETTASNSASTTAIGPVVKIRFPMGDRAAVFLSGSAGITKVSSSGGDVSETGDTDGKFYSAGAGINFFFVETASLNLGASYSKSTFTQSGASVDTNSTGLTVGIGFSLYFGGR